MRTKRYLSSIILAGWCLLVIVGQGIIPKEIIWLEYLAVAWLIVGILTIESSDAISLLILTYPAFMCEKHREWAWVQPILVLILLIRMLLGSQLSRAHKLIVCLVGMAVLWVSLPSEFSELISRLFLLPKRRVLILLARPDAAWFTFPLRASIDRALIAMLVAFAVMDKTFFSSHRIWQAWWLSASIAIVTTLCVVLLPWQKPHHFLGTTNYPFYGSRMFHGPGYNIHFFSLLIIIGIPSFFLPVHDKLFYFRMATIGMLPPILWIHQRAFSLSVLMVLTCSIFFTGMVYLKHRYNFLHIVGIHLRSISIKHILYLLCGLLLSCAWFVKMGGLDSNSTLVIQLRRRWYTFFSMEAIESSGIILPKVKPKPSHPLDSNVTRSNNSLSNVTSIGGKPPILITPTNAPLPSTGSIRRLSKLSDLAKKWLVYYDPARGEMWWLCIKTCTQKYIWYGAGAGTWGRFHRAQPRAKKQPYYAHLHNTYLDILFEYGIIFTAIIFLICAWACFKIAFGKTGISRYWLFYLVGTAVMALGQNLLYSFSTTILIFPLFVVIIRTIISIYREKI